MTIHFSANRLNQVKKSIAITDYISIAFDIAGIKPRIER